MALMPTLYSQKNAVFFIIVEISYFRLALIRTCALLESVNITAILRYDGKIQCSSALPIVKYNCIVLFLSQLYYLIFF